MCPSRNLPEQDRKIPVSGDGPSDARLVFVGEAPGKEENNRHRPFVGKTGEELNNTYLPMAGVSRPDVYFTNACKCHWADSGDAPPEWLVKSCSEFHLKRELAEINPQMVILMGGTSNDLMGYDVEMEHGTLHQDVDLLGWRGDIYSTFHPALGLHMSNKMQALIDDFRDLKGYLRGQLQPIKDAYPSPLYGEVEDPREVRALLKRDWENDPLAVDTESIKRWKGFRSTIRYTHFCTTFCRKPGEAYLVMRENKEAHAELGRWINKYRRLVFHNYPHDARVLAQSDVIVGWEHVFDTMSGAYHDARLPRALKPLAYKLCGIAGDAFDDIVDPYGYDLALEYFTKALMHKWPLPVQEETGDMTVRNCADCKGKGKISNGLRGKLRREYPCESSEYLGTVYQCVKGKVTVPKMTRKQSMNDKLSRLVTDLGKSNVKLLARWEGWEDDVLPLIEKLGPMPLPSIDNVPRDLIVKYAAGDADKTLRVLQPLKSRLVAIRRKVRGWQYAERQTKTHR